MKNKKYISRESKRVSRHDNLPLLRGMFVSPKSSDRKYMPDLLAVNFSFYSDEELILTSGKGLYPGE